jgi:hypothetical protein
MKEIFLVIIIISSLIGFFLNAPVPTAIVPTASIQSAGVQSAGLQNKAEYVLCQSFAASKAEFQRITVNGWALVNTAFMQPEELMALARQAAKVLGDEKRLDYYLEETPYFIGVALEGVVAADTYVEVFAQTLANRPDPAWEGNETFLLINLIHSGDRYALSRWKERVNKAFQQFGAKPHVSMAITGFFPGYLDQREARAQVKKILQRAEAKWVEGMTEGNLISVSGYTGNIQHHLVVGGRRVNINVALRYHETVDRTYLDIGSPLLDGSY